MEKAGNSEPEQLRRSERLKEKNKDIIALSELQEPQNHTTEELVEDIRSRSVSRHSKKREQIKMKAEIKKRQLEFIHQQKMVELEMAMELAELDETDSEIEATSVSELNKPEIEEWVSGRNPWQNSTKPEPKRNDSIKVGENNDNISHESSLVDLPKILIRQSIPKNLPLFSGDPTDWPNFIFQFENTTTLCKYSKENQCRLQKCLKGPARKIVESLLIFPSNVDKIIEILRNRFGRPELIVMILLDKVKNLSMIKEDKLDSFLEFSDEVKNITGTMETLNQEDHLRNPILLQELLDKLPTSYKLNWVEFISERKTGETKLLVFRDWLDRKANFACQLVIPKLNGSSCRFNKSKGKYSEKRIVLTTNEHPDRQCHCCQDKFHFLNTCKKFGNMTVDERWKFVTTNKFCFSCLTPNHNLKSCKNIKICGIDSCSRPHHKLLHKNIDKNDSQTNNEVSYHISTDKNVLLKILPVVLSKNGIEVNTYALLDDASSVSLINQDLADKMKLDGPEQILSLQWTHNQVEQYESKVVTCFIRGQQENKKYMLRHLRTSKGLSLPIQTIKGEEMKKKYPYLGERIISMTNARPEIIIGQDNWPLLMNRKFICGPWNSPALTKTLLGWVIHGNVSNLPFKFSNQYICHLSHEGKDDLDILHDLVKRQWQIDCSGLETTKKTLSLQDKRAQSILDNTMKKNGDRYETGLLWKRDNFTFPESKNMAMKRLECTERKMDRNFQFGKNYCEKMLELENKNYIRKLSDEDASITTPKTWYLPHFGVFNPNKPNKLRIVFDAASKSNGISLNDYLLTGPDLYNSLYDILLNFRIKKFAFTADIKEMFLQVQVRKEDKCAQRFLWRGMDRTRFPDVYEIMVVFFGSTSGPCLAQEAKNKNALEYENEFPEATRAILKEHYMDD